MASITTSPINCFAQVEYWQTKPKLSIARLQAVDWNLVVLVLKIGGGVISYQVNALRLVLRQSR
jgi:hypothetical protein